jgi:hypothetical protein
MFYVNGEANFSGLISYNAPITNLFHQAQFYTEAPLAGAHILKITSPISGNGTFSIKMVHSWLAIN